jgi:hypothetical protein
VKSFHSLQIQERRGMLPFHETSAVLKLLYVTTVPAPKIGPLETLDFFGFLPDSGARMHLARLVPHQKG